MRTDDETIKSILTRNVSEVIVKKDLEEKLRSGKQLRVKFGIDPSGSFLTLGHMVAIQKLKQLQDAGHQIVLLIGNFTAQIGDPTGKTQTRVPLTQEQVEKNAENYMSTVGKILDMDKVEIVYNADWLNEFNFSDVLKLAANFTVAQMLERDMYQERIKKDLPISLHEFLYPLMQGYDSVPIKADLEVGGTDQTFNLLAGRVIQKAHDQAPQSCLTVKLLVGTDGVKKMGKSENNFVAVLDEPTDMFGKVMSIPDDIIINWYELCTQLPDSEIKEIEKRLADGENPRNVKMDLAHTIVEEYHDTEAADHAKNEFINVFSKGGLPEEIECVKVSAAEQSIVDLITDSKMVASKSEARRMIQSGAVKINQEKVTESDAKITVKEEILVQVGKRKYLKFQPE